MYNMFGTQLPRQFSLGSEVQRDGILDCQLYSDGLVVLTKALQLWAVSGLEEPRSHRLAGPCLKDPPHCMAILQPRHTLSGCLEVLTSPLLCMLLMLSSPASLMLSSCLERPCSPRVARPHLRPCAPTPSLLHYMASMQPRHTSLPTLKC